jgi:hypothetical protein
MKDSKRNGTKEPINLENHLKQEEGWEEKNKMKMVRAGLSMKVSTSTSVMYLRAAHYSLRSRRYLPHILTVLS